MRTSQLEANTFGVGQLIAQRKMFAVPEHQRSFAWTTEQVEDFLTDIAQAQARNAPDYFIGLIVVLGPVNTVWQILDGQQRLATTTMLYAAIRDWLQARNHKDDAKQIQDEFIAVRQLGGALVPRLRLNVENREVFKDNIVASRAIDVVAQLRSSQPRNSSNHRLLDAALFCCKWVNDFAGEKDAQRLYKLADYVESRVKAVCLGVSNESDAFILFESLNARGVDLSALDLVKNYIFASVGERKLPQIRSFWASMMAHIEGKDVDDFLKVFWTSRFGVVQKLELFHNIQNVYKGEAKVCQLASELAADAARFYALDDSEHELWNEIGALGRQLVADRMTLGSKQVRPVMLAAMRTFTAEELRWSIWALIVLIVRYQIVGRGRTGILEKQLGAACEAIHKGTISTSTELYNLVSPILSEVGDFETDFQRLLETKSRRVLYFLLELESSLKFKASRDVATVLELKGMANRLSPQHIAPWSSFPATEDEQTEFFALANRCILEDSLAQGLQTEYSVQEKIRDTYTRSAIELTKSIGSFGRWPHPALRRRGKALAKLAADTWAVTNPLYA